MWHLSSFDKWRSEDGLDMLQDWECNVMYCNFVYQKIRRGGGGRGVYTIFIEFKI